MGDEPRIHVEPGDPGGNAWSGPDASSRHVVHEPTRWSRGAAALVLVGLVVGGLVLSLAGSGEDDGPDEPPLVSAHDAYTAAVARLGRARSFAFSGEVHAAERSPLRPGAWLDDEVRVEGAVLLPHSITREIAFVPGGDAAVETVTSGPTAWSRTASSRSALPDKPWERVAWTDPQRWGNPNPESFGSRRLGIALVIDVLRAAGDRRRDPPDPSDADGNRVLHATVGTGGGQADQVRDLLAGAEVTLELDEAGDITDLTLTSATSATSAPAGDRRLVVELAIERLGEPGLITTADVGRPARGAVPRRDLAAVGVHALDLSWLPSGWALTDAQVGRTGPVVMCGGGVGRCIASDEGCPVLDLDYHDLTEVSGGRLSLSIMSESCFAGRYGTGRDAWAEPFRAGAFAGSVDERSTTIGEMSDGETTVSFLTDLSAADVAAVLATLAPLDAAADPAVLPGIPSS